jgi:acetyl esterase/lipase
MSHTLLLTAALLTASAFVFRGQARVATMRLWDSDAPGAIGKTELDIPTLTRYQASPQKANGTAVVVCPGGGYGMLAGHEELPPAQWLNSQGVTAFVLKYRLGPRYHHPVMGQDVQRAIRMVRARAAEWGIDPNRIGVLGFSAGGHLASTAATHFSEGNPNAADPIERVSSRPDFAVLIYPVITMTAPYAHEGSRRNLLGENPAPDLLTLLSNEKQVRPNTPPTFLVHGANDSVVACQNSLMFADACRKKGVPVELHLYEDGEHGFGMGGQTIPVGTWPARCSEWLKGRGLLKRSQPNEGNSHGR